MANKTIPQLPEQTGKTDDDLLVIVDSGETTTSKIKVSTLLDGVGGSPLVTYSGTTTRAVDSEFEYLGTPFEPNGFDPNYNNLVFGWGNNQTGVANTTTRNNVIFGFDNTIKNNTNARVVVGYNNDAGDSCPVIIGLNSGSDKGICIGDNADGGGNNNGSLSLGWSTLSNGFRSFVIGADSAYASNRGVAIGASADATNYSFAAGSTAKADGGGFYNVCLLDNDITSTEDYNAILGGQNNQITGTTSGTTIIGLNNFTATADDMVYIPALNVVNYASLNFADDTAAAAGGVELGGLYHNAGAVRIRIT